MEEGCYMSQQTFWTGDEEPPPTKPPWQSVEDGERRPLPPKGQRGMKGLVFPTEKAKPILPPKKERHDFRLNKATPRVETREGENLGDSQNEGNVEKLPEKVEMTSEHLAAQLTKLHRMGFIKGMDDPDLIFYCKMIVDFGATVVEK